jgi:hypothetical protein
MGAAATPEKEYGSGPTMPVSHEEFLAPNPPVPRRSWRRFDLMTWLDVHHGKSDGSRVGG